MKLQFEWLYNQVFQTNFSLFIIQAEMNLVCILRLGLVSLGFEVR